MAYLVLKKRILKGTLILDLANYGFGFRAWGLRVWGLGFIGLGWRVEWFKSLAG